MTGSGSKAIIPIQNVGHRKTISYGRQSISRDDIEAVVSVLESDWLTTGPAVDAFETAVAGYVGARFGVAVSSGTAALHCAGYALGVGPGDEVIVPAMTFAASANWVVYLGATPVFVDVDPDTLLIDVDQAGQAITGRTKAIVAVDYAGHPCHWDRLRQLAESWNIKLLADGCHALGARYHGTHVGALADLTVFSFHPVKHITTGEGGMVVTDNPSFVQRMRRFRNHGIATDFRQRETMGSWYYEMVDLGYNYRITDIQCALGISQLQRLDRFLAHRRHIADLYDTALAQMNGVQPLATSPGVDHAYHLYVVRIGQPPDGPGRDAVFQYMRDHGIGVNVHYIPVHLHPFYRQRYGTAPGNCPKAEAAYEQILSLPIHPGITDADVARIMDVMAKALASS